MHNDVRLKVHLVLETTDGAKIAEVGNAYVLPDVFDEPSLRTAEASLARTLEVTVLSPARALIRAHVDKLLDQVSFRRRVPVCPSVPCEWPQESEVIPALNDRLAAVMAKAKSEDYAAAR